MAVPLPLSMKVTPLGRVPVSAMVGEAAPLVVTVKLPGLPTVKLVLVALVKVIVEVEAVTVSVKDWVVLPAELMAPKVIG